MDEEKKGPATAPAKKEYAMYSTEMRESLVRDYLSSGGKVPRKRFALEHGIKPSTFDSWVWKAQKNGARIQESGAMIDIRPVLETQWIRLRMGTLEIEVEKKDLVAFLGALSRC